MVASSNLVAPTNLIGLRQHAWVLFLFNSCFNSISRRTIFMGKHLQFLIVSILLLLAVASPALSLSSQKQNPCDVVMKKVRQGALLVDVRTKEEFMAGTLPGSINVPFDRIESQLQLFPTDRQKEIVLFCKSGRRSELGKQTLARLGYVNVINAGGYADLIKCWSNK